MSDDILGSPAQSPDGELLLAYFRGELLPEAHAQLLARLAGDSALREALETLEIAAQIAQDEASAQTTDAAFERFAMARQVRQTQRARDAHTERGRVDEPPILSASRTVGDVPRARGDIVSRSPVARLAGWMRRYATIVQPAFAVLVLAQAGVIAHYLSESPSTQAPPAVVRGAHGSCNDVWITFKDDTGETALRNWLTLYDASIVDGPDLSGRYRISTHDDASRLALLGSSDAARIVLRAEAPQGCQGSRQ